MEAREGETNIKIQENHIVLQKVLNFFIFVLKQNPFFTFKLFNQ